MSHNEFKYFIFHLNFKLINCKNYQCFDCQKQILTHYSSCTIYASLLSVPNQCRHPLLFYTSIISSFHRQRSWWLANNRREGIVYCLPSIITVHLLRPSFWSIQINNEAPPAESIIDKLWSRLQGEWYLIVYNFVWNMILAGGQASSTVIVFSWRFAR